MVNVEANESIGSPKRKDPLPELQSPKGGFLRLAACQSLSLWERWHCEAMTERASPAGKSRCAAIGRLFVRAILSLCLGFAVSGLALSVSLRSPAPPKGEPLACRLGSPSYNLSVCFADSSPSRGASGEEEKFSAMPKPPLGRSNGDDRRQWRKQGGAVGAAASRMRAAAKQTLGAATRAVALRSNDGEGKPGTKEPQAQR